MPCRDSPYFILCQRSPTIFEVTYLEDPAVPIQVYHTSAVRPHQDPSTELLTHYRKRDRIRKSLPGRTMRRCQGQMGRL
ncbi:uncharacterized protein TNCV_4369301 [Trichonephila clavipes]|nr:uncharacterized protein TNCV_4369301 [Trichonephila clavipes]